MTQKEQIKKINTQTKKIAKRNAKKLVEREGKVVAIRFH